VERTSRPVERGIKKKSLKAGSCEKRKVERHSYDLVSIAEALRRKLQTSASFRSISKTFLISKILYEQSCRSPSHTTIINWVHKIGYYQLTSKKEKADDWVLILDHSIQLGKEKVFVILGIREKNIDFTRPLQFHDLLPLREISKEYWSGEIIRDCLIDLKNEIGNIKYAVGDHASCIKKGLEMAQIPHVHDVKHKMAIILKRCYKNHDAFQSLIKEMADFRRNLQQTKFACIIPPRQRAKARYHNIDTVVQWGLKALQCVKKEQTEIAVKEKLQWILQYEDLLCELSALMKIVCEIEAHIKNFGISKTVTVKYSSILAKWPTQLPCENFNILKNEFNVYLEKTLDQLPSTPQILASSDIIESAFGKYKNYVSQNPMAGITNLVLAIAAFTSSLELDEIKKALESRTKADITTWTQKFIGKTILQRRKGVFGALKKWNEQY